jgi:hypothetical protein
MLFIIIKDIYITLKELFTNLKKVKQVKEQFRDL